MPPLTLGSLGRSGSVRSDQPPFGVPLRLLPPVRAEALSAVTFSRSFSGAPVIGDVCVSHPLAGSNVRKAATCDGAAAAAADKRKHDKHGRAGSGAFTLVPLSHETYGRICPAAFAFLNRVAGIAAGSGAASRRLFLENAIQTFPRRCAVRWLGRCMPLPR